MRRVLIFVRSRIQEARKARPSQYRAGYIDALTETEEQLERWMWEDGEDA